MERWEDAVPAVKIRRDELEIVKEAAIRVERRSNSRFVLDQKRVEVADEGSPPAKDSDEEQPTKPPVVFD
jgi:hypothetical protein